MKPILWIALLIALFYSVESFGGMDFTSRRTKFYDGYELPEFKNRTAAEEWADDNKYEEPLRRMLKHRIVDLYLEAHPISNDLDTKKLKKVSELMSMVEMYQAALDVMERNKKKDRAMLTYAADFYAESIPIN